MLKMFYTENISVNGTVTDPKIDDILSQIRRDLENVINYYSHSERRVNNSNTLVSLLNTLAIDYTLPIYEYLPKLDNVLMYNSKTFGIVSTVNKGSVLEGVVFRENSREIFIENDTDIDYTDLNTSWREHSAIRVLLYDGVDLGILAPNSDIDFKSDTLSVFAIDLKLMLIQFKYWAMEMSGKGIAVDKSHFVSTVLFTGIIKDLLDMAIWNRFTALGLGYSVNSRNITKHPFVVADVTTRLDKELIRIYSRLKNMKITYSDMLKNIPTVSSGDVYNLLKVGKFMNSKQNMWGTWLSKIYHIADILGISNIDTIRVNSALNTELMIDLPIIENKVNLIGILPITLENDYRNTMDYIKDKIRRT